MKRLSRRGNERRWETAQGARKAPNSKMRYIISLRFSVIEVLLYSITASKSKFRRGSHFLLIYRFSSFLGPTPKGAQEETVKPVGKGAIAVFGCSSCATHRCPFLSAPCISCLLSGLCVSGKNKLNRNYHPTTYASLPIPTASSSRHPTNFTPYVNQDSKNDT